MSEYPKDNEVRKTSEKSEAFQELSRDEQQAVAGGTVTLEYLVLMTMKIGR